MNSKNVIKTLELTKRDLIAEKEFYMCIAFKHHSPESEAQDNRILKCIHGLFKESIFSCHEYTKVNTHVEGSWWFTRGQVNGDEEVKQEVIKQKVLFINHVIEILKNE